MNVSYRLERTRHAGHFDYLLFWSGLVIRVRALLCAVLRVCNGNSVNYQQLWPGAVVRGRRRGQQRDRPGRERIKAGVCGQGAPSVLR